MTRILTSSAGQQYAVDDEFLDRLREAGVDAGYDSGEIDIAEGSLADLLDFLSVEGLI